MPASYSDVIFAKLALQQSFLSALQLQECLNAQEAGQLAGVTQSLAQVAVKRGYLTNSFARQLDEARALAERSRRAKLSVQLLLRHGRPTEEVLRACYEELKSQGFPREVGEQLDQDGHLEAAEVAALTTAVGRAWDALYDREARELGGNLRAALTPAPPPYGYPGAPGSPYATGFRPAYPGPMATGAMIPAYGGGYPPPAPPGYGYNGGYAQPHPGHMATGMRPAYGGGYDYGAPAPMGMPQQPSPMQPQAPVPVWMSGQRAAYPGPGYQNAPTTERVARMDLLPDWAHTRERPAHPLDGPAPSSGPIAPPPMAAGRGPRGGAGAGDGAAAARGDGGGGGGGGGRPRKLRKLEEPTGNVPGYEHIERVGRGKVGVVWKARELASGRIVALKVMLPVFMENEALVERFLREAKLAASLDHPNIRKAYTGGQAGGLLYLAMEFVDGETLQDKIDRDGRLPEEDCLRWSAQIARAMDHYNRQGVLHRDVKPANILVDQQRRAMLCDLGISKRVFEDFALTKQGTTLGSPFYISPEQGMGTDDLDIRSDLYSLGVTMYHCLTGRVPFLGGNAGVIISKHAREPLPDPQRLNPDLSDAVSDLVKKLCAKQPEDRPQTPKQLLAEIQWIRTEIGGGVNTPIAPLDPPGDESLDEMRTPARSRDGLVRRFLRALGLVR